MPARALMFQGTGSHVGKSLIVAGLARSLRRRGLRVRPFKPQNMSNNAAVTADGGEIGRAQALQARAAGIAPSVHMNPVLLKPQSEIGSQIIVQGRLFGTANAQAYQAIKPSLMPAVLDSFARLSAEADVVLVEGAGSASEVNLRAGDIANMGFARQGNVPVVLVGDIERGGVIASLVGTKTVLAADDAAMIAGFVVNKFRGDPSLFRDGMGAIARATGWTALGLLPYFDVADRLPEEDALGVRRSTTVRPGARPRIVVLAYPRMANFDDFDPLRLEPGIDLDFLRPGEPIPGDAALVVLPGSKATIADLAAVRDSGWHIDLTAHVRRGGRVLGICGGYQMLGTRIADPDGREGPAGAVDGLGLLEVETTLEGDKVLAAVAGRLLDGAARLLGYEMHIGRTTGPATARPLIALDDGRVDGAQTPGGRVAGCYVHGLFGGENVRSQLLRALGAEISTLDYAAEIDAALDALATHIERHLDVDEFLALAREPNLTPPVTSA
jgi:adenosylcobyric acid synthase